MILSTNAKLNEYDLVREPDHIAKVWATVEKAMPKYWDAFVAKQRESTPIAKLLAKFGGQAPTEAAIVAKVFENGVEKFEKDAKKYQSFFDPAAMDEFSDDPNAFKLGLSKEVPVIARTLQQRQAELAEWQRNFRSSRPNDLLTVFENILDFYAGWSKKHSPNQYREYDSPDDFDLDDLEDEKMSLVNVIGMGIKSFVLFHLDPERLPPRGRNGLYGLFFLSDKGHFGLPSKSSEFLMINDRDKVSDGSMIMDQNYWYPYGTFLVYASRVYRWIEQRAKTASFAIDPKRRYVYVDCFFQSVCDHHASDLKTMRAHERFEVPA